MKQIAAAYIFNPVAATVTLTGLSIGLNQLLGIFDNSTGVALYTPDAPGLVPTISGPTITLNASAPLIGAQSTDALLIIYDDQISASIPYRGTITQTLITLAATVSTQLIASICFIPRPSNIF